MSYRFTSSRNFCQCSHFRVILVFFLCLFKQKLFEEKNISAHIIPEVTRIESYPGRTLNITTPPAGQLKSSST